MFYSQFILAKKGPLGTIWIAAHLERKLRKNQVADTDIGVSVDSILFPEVPIALRLSSHLLLGVVRIYSRKVSYLFDDCSEALLKVKQAFRSTAVDLPPEESTAPYHSITLPETFDLDDFELPDNDIFQGNYVDHHVSAREQITLQDTMEGVVYSTSQFGLDERFGDGDASQVGLDLEEDLFLDKVEAPEIDTVERADPQMSDGSFLKGEASQEGESSEAIPMNGTTNKIKGLVANSEFTDGAQAPSTPGLIEEPNLSTVEEGLAYDDNLDSEDHNLTELGEIDIQQNASNKQEFYNKNNAINLSLGDPLNHDNMVYMPAEDDGCLSGDEKVNQAELQDLSTIVNADNVAADKFDGGNKVEPTNNDVECINESSMPSLDQMNGECEQNVIEAGLHKTAENGDDEEKSDAEGKTASNVATPLKLPCHPEHTNYEAQDIQRLEDSGTLDDSVDNEKTVSTLPTVLRACNSHTNHHETLSNDVNDHTVPSGVQTEEVPYSVETSMMEEELHDCGTSAKVQGDGSHMTDCILAGENQADVEKQDEHLVNQVDNFDNSHITDVPAFEKLLSAPEILSDKPDDLVVESTPDKEVLDSVDGSIDGTKISGRKRSFTESTLTMETLNSAESFGATRSKRTADFIPDDDDLLSSILVGRKSSALKMKPTPPMPEATSMKRTRSATKPSATKRKVLMDDSMVLLGDVIREQLTNTEDIRRLRKKAPCTRTEILMIQRQFLEEEIFSELVLTGISSELAYVHGGTFDLSGISISEVGDDNGFTKVMKDEGCLTQPMPNKDDQIEHRGEPNGIDGQPADHAVVTGNQHGENHVLGINHDSVAANSAEIAGNGTSIHQTSSEMCETRIDVGNAEIPGDGNHAVILGHDTSHIDLVSRDIDEIPSSSVVSIDVRDDPTSAENSLNIHNESIENVAFPRDMANGEAPGGFEILDHSAIEPESMGEELPMMEIKDAAQAEIREEIDASDFASAKEDGASLVDLASEMAGCTSSVNQAVENIAYHDPAVANVDGSVTVNLGFSENDKITNNFGNEESEMASKYLGLDAETKDGSINDPGQPLCQEADQQSTMNTEITSLGHFTDGNFGDFEDTAVIHDTEFLNMDDDEDDEEDDHGVMNAEEARLLDNSGWSSRTRAVASYLQNLFDKENGRRVLSVDNLLVGKTRKEASRMFFETLVLKTRDYIQVEQTKPFDDINIKARPKLMKSGF